MTGRVLFRESADAYCAAPCASLGLAHRRLAVHRRRQAVAIFHTLLNQRRQNHTPGLYLNPPPTLDRLAFPAQRPAGQGACWPRLSAKVLGVRQVRYTSTHGVGCASVDRAGQLLDALNQAAWTLGRWITAVRWNRPMSWTRCMWRPAQRVVHDDGQRQTQAIIRSGLGAGLQERGRSRALMSGGWVKQLLPLARVSWTCTTWRASGYGLGALLEGLDQLWIALRDGTENLVDAGHHVWIEPDAGSLHIVDELLWAGGTHDGSRHVGIL
jgi:hypothetical protein